MTLDEVKLINVIQTKVFKQMNLKKRISKHQLQELFQIVVSEQTTSKKLFGVAEYTKLWRVSDHYTKKKLILSGLGWGRLPEHMIKKELKKNYRV